VSHVSIRRKAHDSIANACNVLYVRLSIPSYTTHLFIEAILALRVFAMYNRNKSLMLFLSVFGFIAFSFSTVGPFYAHSYSDASLYRSGWRQPMPRAPQRLHQALAAKFMDLEVVILSCHIAQILYILSRTSFFSQLLISTNFLPVPIVGFLPSTYTFLGFTWNVPGIAGAWVVVYSLLFEYLAGLSSFDTLPGSVWIY
jgi:hypothetical protein